MYVLLFLVATYENDGGDALKKGFTLMEMVLVMVIIVILFLLTIPNITKTIGIVNKKGCDVQLKVVDAAILQYIIVNDTKPSSIYSLVDEGVLTERQTYCHDGTRISIQDGRAVSE